MTCAEVQLLLSEYIEKSLDAVRMKAVETHLLACSGCRAETEGLVDCIREISELPLLDPPIGFTTTSSVRASWMNLASMGCARIRPPVSAWKARA